MKLLVQRVARAHVEANGFVESQIGNGMIVYVAVRPGDSFEQAHQLAAKVVKLNLWPDIADKKRFCTNVIDNNFEVLAIFQQPLISNFSKLEPSEGTADATAKAKEIFEAFVQKLKEEYHEEMVMAAPTDEELRVQLTAECPGVYELDTLEMAVQSRLSKSDPSAETARVSGFPLDATVDSVTKCLQRIPLLPRIKATEECMRVFHAFGMKEFRAALTDVSSNDVDALGEALDGAAHLFTTKQQEQITMWTGLAITAAPREDDAEYHQLEAAITLTQKRRAVSNSAVSQLVFSTWAQLTRAAAVEQKQQALIGWLVRVVEKQYDVDSCGALMIPEELKKEPDLPDPDVGQELEIAETDSASSKVGQELDFVDTDSASSEADFVWDSEHDEAMFTLL